MPDEERHALAARVVTTLARQFDADNADSGTDDLLTDRHTNYAAPPPLSTDDDAVINRLDSSSTNPYSSEKSNDTT